MNLPFRIISLGILLLSFGWLSFSAAGQSFQSVFGVATAEVQNIVTDYQNNTLVIGSFLGTRDFDPGPGISNLNSATITRSFCRSLIAPVNSYLLRNYQRAISKLNFKLIRKGTFMWQVIFTKPLTSIRAAE